MKLKTMLTTLVSGTACALMAIAPANADQYDRYANNRSGDVILFEHAGFQGQAIEINGAVPRLSDARFNDRASSIAIRRGAWEVCEHVNFQGRCEIIQGDVEGLTYLRLNDQISSIRPVSGRFGFNHRGNDNRYGRHDGYQGRDDMWGYNDGPVNRADLVLFEDGYFSGRAVGVNGDLHDFRQTGLNDEVSSIQVNRGVWEVCSDAGFQGRCTVIYGSTGSLQEVRLNDAISSVRRIG